MPTCFDLIITTDYPQRTAELRLLDMHGSQLAYRLTDFKTITLSRQQGLFDLRNYLRDYVETGQEAAAVAEIGVCIAEQVLGPDIFPLLQHLARPAPEAQRRIGPLSRSRQNAPRRCHLPRRDGGIQRRGTRRAADAQPAARAARRSDPAGAGQFRDQPQSAGRKPRSFRQWRTALGLPGPVLGSLSQPACDGIARHTVAGVNHLPPTVGGLGGNAQPSGPAGPAAAGRSGAVFARTCGLEPDGFQRRYKRTRAGNAPAGCQPFLSLADGQAGAAGNRRRGVASAIAASA